MENGKSGILTTAMYNFDVAAKRLGLDSDIRQKILGPKEKVEIDINPKLPNGRMINAKVFIVRHHDALGPAKGGIRMTPSVTLDEVTGLAMEMTWKTSLIGVPFGGGKSGIRLDPAKLTDDEKEAVIRAFERGASRHIGPEIYIPAPDMGTNEMDMAHIRDCISYSQGVSITKGCFVTGKPVILGGIVGRREATGKGVVYTILSSCEKLNKDIKKMSVAVQGFGNVGSVAAAEIARHGARVVAVCDAQAGLKNDDGIDIQALERHFVQKGTLKGFPGCKEMAPTDIFAVDCDILIPAAAGSQITLENVDKIKASIIAEGANAPTIPEADEVLASRSVMVVPDILCNAGGVFVSYLEYTQETQREQMTLEAVENRLSSRMAERFNDVYDLAAQKGITMRQAAMDIAVSRVLEAVRTRGLLP
ncbi:MAG: Glu/Leu/Phe/Val dehydrogenase [Anaerohalosphaera sp.]|nr:Glu/Leu/Phe/Val dehydrogenase [Anaerohalosphaera sp.]